MLANPPLAADGDLHSPNDTCTLAAKAGSASISFKFSLTELGVEGPAV
jgi:hypothetical protein